MKNGALLYVEFTPYYSVIGHHLYDFAKWPIHILPRKFIRQFIFSKPVKGFLSHEDYWVQFESLNKLKISRFQKMVKTLRKLSERYIIKYPEVIEMDLPIIGYLGPFKDYLTMSFAGIYQKI